MCESIPYFILHVVLRLFLPSTYRLLQRTSLHLPHTVTLPPCRSSFEGRLSRVRLYGFYHSFGRYYLLLREIYSNVESYFSIHTAKSTHWIQLYLESDHSLIVDHTIYPYNSPDRLTYFYVEPYIHPVSPPGYTLQTSLILLSDISPTFFQPSHLFDSCCSNLFCDKSATLWLVYTPYFDGSVTLWQF